MAQYSRPSSDISAGTWTTTPLWSKIDETFYDEADLINGPNRASSTCQLGLTSVTDPTSSSGHILRIRAYCTAGITLGVELRMGAGNTLIASWAPSLTTSFATYTYTLTAGEADSITDYTALKVYLVQTYSSGTGTRRAYVACFEFEVPNAPVSLSDQQPSFIQGISTITDSQLAYVLGIGGSTDSQAAFVQGKSTATDQQPSYIEGIAPSATDQQPGYIQGQDTSTDQQPSYVRGESTSTDVQPSYVAGADTATDNQIAFVQGRDTTTDQQSAYIAGYTTAVALVPISDIGQSGSWVNETSGSSPLYDSLDEQPSSDDDDYVTHVNASGTEYFEVGLTAANGTPSTGDVVIHFRGKDNSSGSTITVELRQGGTVIATKEQVLTGSNADYTYTLTAGEKASITNWNDLRLRVTVEEQ